jgi:hypothetical protein
MQMPEYSTWCQGKCLYISIKLNKGDGMRNISNLMQGKQSNSKAILLFPTFNEHLPLQSWVT